MRRFAVRKRLMFNREDLKNLTPLLLVLLIATASFMYGWYFDSSKPQSGMGWADQDYYKRVTDLLIKGEPLVAQDLHYSVGYSILGVIGYLFISSDPFLVVSLLLFLGSIIFCFLASKKLFGLGWAVIFCLLLLAWDGFGKTFNFITELFVMPWNNQVVFFGMSFFLWALSVKVQKPFSYKMAVITGIVAGLCMVTREETILFFAPLIAILLYLGKADFKKWIVCGVVVVICIMPQIYYKMQATGSVLVSTHDDSYGTTLTQKYFQPKQLIDNTASTIINSNLYHEPTDRIALFQAAPWLWLSVPGVVFVLFSRRHDKSIKVYLAISLLLLMFYLSGANMSGQKLRFHCLRYISPALIALNLSVVVFAKEVILLDTVGLRDVGKRRREKHEKITKK